MTTDLLSGCHIKIERAKEHVRNLETEIKRFLSNNPYQIRIEDDTNTGDQIYRLKVWQQPPARFGAIAGDAVHNLRSALDLLACQMLVANGRTPNSQTYFPICDSRDSFKPKGLRKIEGASAKAIRLVERLKPYKGGNEVFWRIHRLDIADKHRLLLSVGTVHRNVIINMTSRLTLNLGDKPFSFPPITGLPANRVYPLKDNAEIFRVLPAARNATLIKYDYELFFDIAFGDGEVVEGEPVIPVLDEFVNFTERIIKIFRRHIF